MGSKMTLVNIDPHVILHQKTHVPRAVNFFESQTASQHPPSEVNKIKNSDNFKSTNNVHIF